MAGGPGESENVVITEPWSGARSHVTFLYSEARAAYNRTNDEPYTGQFFATGDSFYGDVNQALNQFAVQSDRDADRLLDEALEVLLGRYVDHNTNPHLGDAADEILRKMRQRWENHILPAARDEAIAAGAFGGSDQNELINNRLDDLATEVAGALISLYLQGYSQERNIQASVHQWFQMIYNLKDARLKTILMRQQIIREREQIRLDENLQHHIDEHEAQWRGIGEFAQVLFGGGFNSRTSLKPTNPWTSILQGAIGGATAGTNLFTAFNRAGATAAAAEGAGAFAAAAGPWAIPLAVLGGAAGAMGS